MIGSKGLSISVKQYVEGFLKQQGFHNIQGFHFEVSIEIYLSYIFFLKKILSKLLNYNLKVTG